MMRLLSGLLFALAILSLLGGVAGGVQFAQNPYDPSGLYLLLGGIVGAVWWSGLRGIIEAVMRIEAGQKKLAAELALVKDLAAGSFASSDKEKKQDAR